MKNYIRRFRYLFTLLLVFLFLSTSNAQNAYVITKKMVVKNIFNSHDLFGGIVAHGIDVNSSSQNWSDKVEVTVKTRNSLAVKRECGTEPSSFNLQIYQAYVEGNTIGLEHSATSKTYYSKGWHLINYDCYTAKTDTYDYYSNMAEVANYYINGWNWFSPKEFDVEIELKLPSEIKLSDIKRISIPGVGALFPSDFVNREYVESHDCYNNNSGVCAELNKVRNIPDLTKTDVVIQAHRGIWGKPNTNQENTMGAMIAAKIAGYKLLESDIMPIKVKDGGNYINSTSGKPEDLACFHDFILSRYTSETNVNYKIYNRDKNQLKALSLKEPRSESLGTEKIMMFDELVDYAVNNDLIVCVDMKNLESKGQGSSCTELCNWQTQERKNISLYHNLKFAINSTDDSKLKNIAIKTYANYKDLKTALTTGLNPVSESKFNKVLWAPLIAGGSQWEKTGGVNGEYDEEKIQKFLDDWFAHNESVLYYETNFFNDYDNKTSVMLNNVFCFLDSTGAEKCVNVMEYIYLMTGRRAGIFSEEPVGGKGTVNRWGKWGIKNPKTDRRGDHLWLLKHPFFKHAVITTDRPNIWDQLKD